MKYNSALFSLLLCGALLLNSCAIIHKNDTESTIASETTADETTTDESPEPFVFPKTDGSTSTTNLDNAVRSALLGGEHKNSHTKTYMAFDNLTNGKCELIFTTPLSEEQLKTMERRGFRHEAAPIAGEGFVFVVNKDNPVDTLTVEQIKDIYSGKITNWSEVGGNDAEIIAYQRNRDSGSQNYMISFMGDTPLMEPVTEQVPATMSGVLDIIAGYDNGINAIGYSVYAYSDGMYENISAIKYIKVNGIEPSLQTLTDGSYPLLGYNYAVFSADEPENSNVRTLVKWIQSDEGQQVIADAGYVPYRKVDGLTLPEPTVKKLYGAISSSGIPKPDTVADYRYECGDVSDTVFTTEGLTEKVQAFIANATEELSQIDEAQMRAYLDSRVDYGYQLDLYTEQRLINGYLSVRVGWRYYYGVQDAPECYYDVRTAVFDIYTGEQLELSDLFFEDVDFVQLLNQHLAAESEKPYSSFGSRYDMLHEFKGLYEGEFSFTANSIIFRPRTCFADGAIFSLDSLSEYMITSIPRDMAGYVDENTPIYKKINVKYSSSYAEEKNNYLTIWYIDKEATDIPDAVCDKVNEFVDKIHREHFTEEKMLEFLQSKGISADKADFGAHPEFNTSIVGNRYILFRGPNEIAAINDGQYGDFVTVLEGHPSYFEFFFNAETGDDLRVDDLFSDGWADEAELFVYDESFDFWSKDSWVPYPSTVDTNSCRIMNVVNYVSAPYSRGDLSDLEHPVFVCVTTETGEQAAIVVPRGYIK